MARESPLFALAATVMTIAPLPAQAAAPPRPAPVLRAADSWIEQYGQSIAIQTNALRSAGLGADWDRIRPLVERYLPPQSYPQDPDFHDILRRYHIDSTANFLVGIGYRARHLAYPAQARTLVRAANIRSWDDADALVLTSPVVFVAELVRIDRKPDNSADLVYRVTEPIKSAPAKGSEWRYLLNRPFRTIAAKPGDPPPPPPPPNPAAWELSAHQAVLFFRPAPGAINNFFGPMPVDGEKVLPSYHGTTAGTTLGAIRAAARAQLCSPGYVPVVRGIDLPHSC